MDATTGMAFGEESNPSILHGDLETQPTGDAEMVDATRKMQEGVREDSGAETDMQTNASLTPEKLACRSVEKKIDIESLRTTTQTNVAVVEGLPLKMMAQARSTRMGELESGLEIQTRTEPLKYTTPINLSVACDNVDKKQEAILTEHSPISIDCGHTPFASQPHSELRPQEQQREETISDQKDASELTNRPEKSGRCNINSSPINRGSSLKRITPLRCPDPASISEKCFSGENKSIPNINNLESCTATLDRIHKLGTDSSDVKMQWAERQHSNQKPLNSSPLTLFFALKEKELKTSRFCRTSFTPRNKNDSDGLQTVKEWRKGHKDSLLNFFNHRFVKNTDEEDNANETVSDCVIQNDLIQTATCPHWEHEDDGSFSSKIFDSSFERTDDEVGGNIKFAADSTISGQIVTTPILCSHKELNASDIDDESEADNDTDLETQPVFSQASSKAQPLSKHSTTHSSIAESDPRCDNALENAEYPLPFLGTQDLPAKHKSPDFSDKCPDKSAAYPTNKQVIDHGFAGTSLLGVKRKLDFTSRSKNDTVACEDNSRGKDLENCFLDSQRMEGNEDTISADDCHYSYSKATTLPERRKEGGKIWDGSFKSVPHQSATGEPCCSIQQLDFISGTLNLAFCRVIKIWKIRDSSRNEKRRFYNMNNIIKTPGNSSKHGGPIDNTCSSLMVGPTRFNAPLASFDDDGPLCSLYRKVLSMEICQLDESDPERAHAVCPSISKVAMSAFRDGKNLLQKESSRKRKHSIRRIKVFFYGKYADAISAALSCGSSKEFTPFLISLSSVPPGCIFPYFIASKGCNPRLQHYVLNPFGDDEYGMMSPYCICIGNNTSVRLFLEGNHKEFLSFDSSLLKIIITSDDSDRQHSLEGNMIVTRETVLSAKSYSFEFGTSNKVRQSDRHNTNKSSFKHSPSREGCALTVATNQSNFDSNANKDSLSTPNSGDITRGNITRETDKNTPALTMKAQTELASNVEGTRLSDRFTTHTLADLRPLLQRKTKEKSPDIVTLFGVVLSFSPPALTTKKDWAMSMSLIDETLPLPTHRRPSKFDDTTCLSNNINKSYHLTHVPSVTLVLFSREKSSLPLIRSAGDVIFCQNVKLQEFRSEVQLCSRKCSIIAAARPLRIRLPGDELHDSASPKDWDVSFFRYVSGDELNVSLAWHTLNRVWRWGQRRLSEYPTISPYCCLTIGQVSSQSVHDSEQHEQLLQGDLTAFVTSVIPIPDDLRKRDTPRGYLRLWDGTGPPCTDSILLPTDRLSEKPVQSDPPEEVLLKIQSILNSGSPKEFQNKHCGMKEPIALCGRVINATIWEENLWNMIEKVTIIKVGSLVRLRNINISAQANCVNCLSVHSKSSITPLPFDAYEVKLLLQEHNIRIEKKHPFNPATLPPGTCNFPLVLNPREEECVAEGKRSNLTSRNISTLSHCLRKAAPASFTVQFEVMETYPLCDTQSVDGMKKLCNLGKLKTTFKFALRIKDSTADIHAFCLDEVAEAIFGVTAQDVVDKPCQQKKAFNILKKLMKHGSVWEGKIRSRIVNEKLFFVLKSLAL